MICLPIFPYECTFNWLAATPTFETSRMPVFPQGLNESRCQCLTTSCAHFSSTLAGGHLTLTSITTEAPGLRSWGRTARTRIRCLEQKGQQTVLLLLIILPSLRGRFAEALISQPPLVLCFGRRQSHRQFYLVLEVHSGGAGYVCAGRGNRHLPFRLPLHHARTRTWSSIRRLL